MLYMLILNRHSLIKNTLLYLCGTQNVTIATTSWYNCLGEVGNSYIYGIVWQWSFKAKVQYSLETFTLTNYSSGTLFSLNTKHFERFLQGKVCIINYIPFNKYHSSAMELQY